MDYERSAVDVAGLSARIDRLRLGGPEVNVQPVMRDASADIQRFDMLQFNICQQMHAMESSSTRDSIRTEYLSYLLRMLDAPVVDTSEANPHVLPAQQGVENSEAEPLRAPPPNRSTDSEEMEPERNAATPAEPHAKIMYGYQFALNTCEAVSRLVTCRFTITNLEGDRRLTIGGSHYLSTRAIRSVAYTADGIDHFAAEASLGSQAERAAVHSVMVENQPMAATVVFDDIPVSTSVITNLRIAFRSDRREFLVPFASVRIR